MAHLTHLNDFPVVISITKDSPETGRCIWWHSPPWLTKKKKRSNLNQCSTLNSLMLFLEAVMRILFLVWEMRLYINLIHCLVFTSSSSSSLSTSYVLWIVNINHNLRSIIWSLGEWQDFSIMACTNLTVIHYTWCAHFLTNLIINKWI